MSKTGAEILLIAVFAARGTSFFFSKYLLSSMSPAGILAIRFTLAFCLLVLIFFKKLRQCRKADITGGLLLGILYSLTMFLEMYSLRLIDSGVCALIENMSIVLVPLITAVVTFTLPKTKTVLCAALAVIGVGFLSVTQIHTTGGGTGILLSIGSAFSYAFCIIATVKATEKGDPIIIGILQIGVMGVFSLAIALLTGGFTLPETGGQWGLMLILIVLCTCFGFTFQPLGQKYLAAETAAVLAVVNPLTSSLVGITVGGEAITGLKICGYVLILGALLLYNRKQRRT